MQLKRGLDWTVTPRSSLIPLTQSCGGSQAKRQTMRTRMSRMEMERKKKEHVYAL